MWPRLTRLVVISLLFRFFCVLSDRAVVARPTGLDCFSRIATERASAKQATYSRREGAGPTLGMCNSLVRERSVIPTLTPEGVVAWPGHDVGYDDDWLQDEPPVARTRKK
jgi:hypothetical protein